MASIETMMQYKYITPESVILHYIPFDSEPQITPVDSIDEIKLQYPVLAQIHSFSSDFPHNAIYTENPETLSQVDENNRYLLKDEYFEVDAVSERVWEVMCSENEELKEENRKLKRKINRLTYGYPSK